MSCEKCSRAAAKSGGMSKTSVDVAHPGDPSQYLTECAGHRVARFAELIDKAKSAGDYGRANTMWVVAYQHIKKTPSAGRLGYSIGRNLADDQAGLEYHALVWIESNDGDRVNIPLPILEKMVGTKELPYIVKHGSPVFDQGRHLRRNHEPYDTANVTIAEIEARLSIEKIPPFDPTIDPAQGDRNRSALLTGLLREQGEDPDAWQVGEFVSEEEFDEVMDRLGGYDDWDAVEWEEEDDELPTPMQAAWMQTQGGDAPRQKSKGQKAKEKRDRLEKSRDNPWLSPSKKRPTDKQRVEVDYGGGATNNNVWFSDGKFTDNLGLEIPAVIVKWRPYTGDEQQDEARE
jgi:hypothetical protein